MARALYRAGVAVAVGYNPFNTLNLDFSKTRYAGAVVKCRLDVSIDELNAYDEAIEGKSAAEQYEIFAEMFLIEWNLEGADGKSIPATKEGARMAPAPLLSWARSTWRSAIWNVNAPLEDGSMPG